MSKHNTRYLFTVALGSKGMPTCEVCWKWPLLADKCSVCTSTDRVLAAIAHPRIPPTFEAQAKVTKIRDSAFYSISRLVPEEDSPEKGVSSPKRVPQEETTNGEGSPSGRVIEKEEAEDKAAEERTRGREGPSGQAKVSPYLQAKEEKEEEAKGVSTTPKHTEDRKPLPRRREEEKETIKRSRTPKRRQEKEKRRRRRRESGSTEVSGSEVRRQKRELPDSQREKKEF